MNLKNEGLADVHLSVKSARKISRDIEIKADPEEIVPNVTRPLIDIVRPRRTAAVVGEINRRMNIVRFIFFHETLKVYPGMNKLWGV